MREWNDSCGCSIKSFQMVGTTRKSSVSFTPFRKTSHLNINFDAETFVGTATIGFGKEQLGSDRTSTST